MLSLSRLLRFSLLKTKNIYHYALIFFSFHIFFFPQSQPLFFTNIFFFHLIMLSFFFKLAYFFSQSQLHYSTTFFFIMLSLCSQAFIFFIFSFFHLCQREDPLRFFIFLNFFQLQHQLFQMNYDHSFYYYYIDKK